MRTRCAIALLLIAGLSSMSLGAIIYDTVNFELSGVYTVTNATMTTSTPGSVEVTSPGRNSETSILPNLVVTGFLFPDVISIYARADGSIPKSTPTTSTTMTYEGDLYLKFHVDAARPFEWSQSIRYLRAPDMPATRFLDFKEDGSTLYSTVATGQVIDSFDLSPGRVYELYLTFEGSAMNDGAIFANGSFQHEFSITLTQSVPEASSIVIAAWTFATGCFVVLKQRRNQCKRTTSFS